MKVNKTSTNNSSKTLVSPRQIIRERRLTSLAGSDGSDDHDRMKRTAINVDNQMYSTGGVKHRQKKKFIPRNAYVRRNKWTSDSAIADVDSVERIPNENNPHGVKMTNKTKLKVNRTQDARREAGNATISGNDRNVTELQNIGKVKTVHGQSHRAHNLSDNQHVPATKHANSTTDGIGETRHSYTGEKRASNETKVQYRINTGDVTQTANTSNVKTVIKDNGAMQGVKEGNNAITRDANNNVNKTVANVKVGQKYAKNENITINEKINNRVSHKEVVQKNETHHISVMRNTTLDKIDNKTHDKTLQNITSTMAGKTDQFKTDVRADITRHGKRKQGNDTVVEQVPTVTSKSMDTGPVNGTNNNLK